MENQKTIAPEENIQPLWKTKIEKEINEIRG